MSTPEKAVENGAQLLTEYYGSDDWSERLNLTTLDIWSPTDCVLGQLMPGTYFSTALNRVGVPVGLEYRYGFAAGLLNDLEAEMWMDDLTQAWKSYVRNALVARRARSQRVAPSIVRTRACVSDDTRSHEMAGV